jgi:hypothetical protein
VIRRRPLLVFSAAIVIAVGLAALLDLYGSTREAGGVSLAYYHHTEPKDWPGRPTGDPGGAEPPSNPPPQDPPPQNPPPENPPPASPPSTPAEPPSTGSGGGGGGGGGIIGGSGSGPKSGGDGGSKKTKAPPNQNCIDQYNCPAHLSCPGQGVSAVTWCATARNMFGGTGPVISAVCYYTDFDNGSGSWFISYLGNAPFFHLCFPDAANDNRRAAGRPPLNRTETP